LAQSTPVDEIVIVDDGSTDDTQKIVAKYGIKVRYSKIENSGSAAARATAISACTGDWVALCDGDDLWEPSHIENFAQFCRIFPSANLYFANFVILNETSSDKFTERQKDWWGDIIQQSNENEKFHLLNQGAYIAFLDFQPIFQSALIFKQSLYDEVGGIASTVSRINSADAHLTRRLVAYGTIGCSEQVTVQIRKHEDNFSKDYVKNIAGKIMVLENIIDNSLVPVSYVDATKQQIEATKITLFRHLYWTKAFVEARQAFARADKRLLSVVDWLRYVKCVLQIHNK
jgi:glycosyltransferase involved in cell wall biosynthesis